MRPEKTTVQLDLDHQVPADTERGPGTVRDGMAVDQAVIHLQKGIVHGAIRVKDDHLLDRGQEAGEQMSQYAKLGTYFGDYFGGGIQSTVKASTGIQQTIYLS
jgi:hypothetical protein